MREKLGLTRRSMAALLDLDTEITIRNIEKRPDRSMRGTTTEAVLDLLGYRDEAELEAAAAAGRMPDFEAIRARLREAQAISRGRDPEVHFSADLAAQLFRWLAAHPPAQRREILRGVPKSDAAAVAQALVERMAFDDSGGGGGGGAG